MIIDKTSAYIINTKKIYIHDDILVSMEFDRISKKLVLMFQKYNIVEKKYNIEFVDVLGFFMTACDFWGASECVLDFEYIEFKDSILIKELMKNQNEMPNFNLILWDDFIETLLTFSSGDQLRIVCKKINFQ